MYIAIVLYNTIVLVLPVQYTIQVVPVPLLLGGVFCKIKTKSAIKLLVLSPGKLVKIMP